jgi:hypothetical protein
VEAPFVAFLGLNEQLAFHLLQNPRTQLFNPTGRAATCAVPSRLGLGVSFIFLENRALFLKGGAKLTGGLCFLLPFDFIG